MSRLRAEAVIAVENRLDDLGLTDMARTLGRTPGDSVTRIRSYLIEARIAAGAIYQAAAHFNQRPISSHATALGESVSAALALIDKEIAQLHEANSRTQEEILGARMPLKTPRQKMREGDG